MEAQTKKQGRDGEEEGVCVPGGRVCAPRPLAGLGGPHRDQEAFLEEARWEEVEVREVLEAVRGSVGLESSFQDLWHKGV